MTEAPQVTTISEKGAGGHPAVYKERAGGKAKKQVSGLRQRRHYNIEKVRAS